MVPGQNQGLSIQILNSSGQIYRQSKRGLTPEGEGTLVLSALTPSYSFRTETYFPLRFYIKLTFT
jgi:hypothetical protein